MGAWKALLSVILLLCIVSCGPGGGSYSKLAVSDTSEVVWTRDLCDQNVSSRRVSRISTGDFDILFSAGDYCRSQKRTRSFALEGTREARKPVLIIYGFEGNEDERKPVQQSIKDTLPWAEENFRVVKIPQNSDLSVVNRIIAEDRRLNADDYTKDKWVGSVVASHGFVDPQTGRHKTSKLDVSQQKMAANQQGPTIQSTSYNTVDVQKAILGGIGNDAGTVACMLYQCQSGQTINDPEFNDIKENKYNSSQKRVFTFSSAPDRLAQFSPSVENGQIVRATPIEQSVGFLMQQAEDDGLTVDEYERKLESAQLGSFKGFEMTTAYVPNNGGLNDYGDPLGRVSNDVLTPLFTTQGPIVVGAKDAYLLPPGIKKDRYNPEIATKEKQLDVVTGTLPAGVTTKPVEELAEEDLQ